MKIFSLIVILVICPYLIKGIPKLGMVNGIPATSSESLFVVSIRQNNYHICGGSIIGANWVMTAAHCLVPMSGVTVIRFGILGTYDGYPDDERLIRRVTMDGIHIHYGYNITRRKCIHDIALIEVNPRIPLGSVAASISLPAQNERLPSGKYALVLGWGSTQLSGGGNSDTLMTCTVTVNPVFNCHPNKILPEYQFYAGCVDHNNKYTVGRGVAPGDSGGPLVYNRKQIGIVSAYYKDASAPDIYERVSYYRNWIRNISSI